MKKKITTNIKKNVFYIALIGVLLVIGGSFALFTANFIGDKYQVINLNGLMFRYTEEDSAIYMDKAEPMSDEDGKKLDNYFDFNIYLKYTNNYSIPYALLLEELENNTVDPKYIKVYLTDQNDNEIIAPTKMSDLALFKNGDYLLHSTEISTEGIGNNTQYYRLRTWIDESYTPELTYGTEGNVQTGFFGYGTFSFRVNVSSNLSLDNTMANAPVLASNMIPVYYDGSNWVKADELNQDKNHQWYDYSSKMWANAVTVTETNRENYLNADAGTIISMDDINTMLVWIPRFSATTGGTLCSNIQNPTIENNFDCYDKGKINITEEDKEQLITDFTIMSMMDDSGTSEAEIRETVETAIANNDVDTMDSLLQEYPMVLMIKSLSNYIAVSDSDKAVINSMVGDATLTNQLVSNGFGGYLVLMSAMNGQSVTSEIFIPKDDEMVPYLCSAMEVPSSDCGTMVDYFNSIEDNNEKVEMLFQMLEVSMESPEIQNLYTAKATDIVYDLTFNGNNMSGGGAYNGGTQESPGAFNITFVNKDTAAHDAFTFGEQNLSGIWIGKFENSSDTTCSVSSNSAVGSGCNLNTIRPKIIPNVTSWRGAMVSTFFYDILAMTESGNQYGFDKTVDTHMMKNSEWGAVAYLTQSVYGRCTSSTSCTEVGINNNSSYKTGYGAPAGSNSTVENGTYETALGQDASTTGNIYGVYDMSGGANEYVMGVYWDGEKLWSGYSASSYQHSGFNGWLYNEGTNYESGVEYPSDSKYYNVYTTESDYTSSGLQHAMTETSNWYSDYALFVAAGYPWAYRGGYYYNYASAGIFSISGDYGLGGSYYSSRSSITIN